jgi:hypothetical protein
VSTAADFTVYAGSATAATGVHTHSTGTGNISITAAGQDMNGVTLIDFWKTAGPGVVAGTTQLTDADWTVSADGLTITITGATIAAKGFNWYSPDSGAGNRAFRLTTAAGAQAISRAIQAQP